MSKLPVQSGLTLRRLAMKVAEMQDAGVAARKVRPHAQEFYTRMRLLCQEYVPHVDANNDKYMDTMCDAGFCGFTPAGAKCLDCQVFDFQFHPKAKTSAEVMKANGLIVIDRLGRPGLQ